MGGMRHEQVPQLADQLFSGDLAAISLPDVLPDGTKKIGIMLLLLAGQLGPEKFILEADVTDDRAIELHQVAVFLRRRAGTGDVAEHGIDLFVVVIELFNAG